jgi:PAS domain S-box-containing protein
MRWSVPVRIGAGFGLAIVLLGLAGWVGYESTRQLIGTLGDVAHSHAVIEALQSVRSEIQSVESETRGYAISGDPDMLARRNQAAAAVPLMLARLRSIVPDRSYEVRLAELDGLLAQSLAWHARVLDAYRTSGQSAASALIRTGEGGRIMARIERTIDAMRRDERGLLEAREGRARTDASETLWMLFGVGAAACGLLALALGLMLRDIRRRESVEAALRESQARLQAILDNTNAVIYVKDLDSRYLLANRGFEKALGVSRDQVIGRRVHDLLPPAVADDFAEHDRQVLGATHALTFEESIPGTNGSAHTYISVKSALRHADGSAYAICGISTDITDLKKAEAERTRLRTFLDSIIENLPHMVFVKDAQELRFVRFNKAGESLLGFSRRDLIGKNDYDFFPKEEADFFTSKDREVLASGQQLDIPEEPIQTKSGESRVLHTKKVPILDAGGRAMYLLGISEDITERRRIEQCLADLNEGLRHRTEELEATNQELEAFSYSVSHDLRAPLRHIAGFADLLKREAGDALDEKSQRYIEKIVGAATRMGQLIDDLLVFSRMGRAQMRHTSVDLAHLVNEIVAELKEEAKDRTIEWRIEPLPVVRGDPAMLRVALMNLLSNAVKYTRPRPVAIIEVGTESREEGVVVHVRDNGVGFEGQYRHKLFGVFQRLHRPEEFEGTGIGLANVRRIIHRHGGTTWAEGEAGSGACFYFSLPGSGAVTHNGQEAA